MLGYVAIVHIYLKKKFNILIEVKERPAKTKLLPVKLGLRTVWCCSESDSAQC